MFSLESIGVHPQKLGHKPTYSWQLHPRPTRTERLIETQMAGAEKIRQIVQNVAPECVCYNIYIYQYDYKCICACMYICMCVCNVL